MYRATVEVSEHVEYIDSGYAILAAGDVRLLKQDFEPLVRILKPRLRLNLGPARVSKTNITAGYSTACWRDPLRQTDAFVALAGD